MIRAIAFAVTFFFASQTGIAGHPSFSQAGFGQDDPSKMAQLLEFFEKGSLPEARELVGWWSGRCFYSENPSVARSGLLVAQFNSSDGPLFEPDDLIMKWLVSRGAPNSADYFDEITTDKRSSIESLNSSNLGGVVEIQRGSLMTYDTERYTVKTRKYQDFWISKHQLTQDESELKAGDTFVACYFFKKVN